ncbi:unnamed protein product [Penicillium olsonii]|nr:unnamed protein product [Penicillium olsonii]
MFARRLILSLAFARPPQQHSRQYSGTPTTNYSYPPPPQGTPPANGGYAVPRPPSNPPAVSPQPTLPGYTSTQFPPPPSSASPPSLDQEKIKLQNEAAHEHNATIETQSTSSSLAMPHGIPAAGQFVGAYSATQDDVGTFNGGSYRISHRDTNSILTIQLAKLAPFIAKPGAMIAMSHGMGLRGSISISLKKLLAGGDMSISQYTGPGELLLAPPVLGDIIVHRVTDDKWKMSRDAFLAHTAGVSHKHETQGLTQAVFSGEGLFVYTIKGEGLIWMQSFGAIVRKDIAEGEIYYVDNGHLVAWNCEYKITRIASGGLLSSFSSGEGVVCKFTGPGTVYLQTRNVNAFATQMKISTASG